MKKTIKNTRISIATVGCKVNQYESGLLAGAVSMDGLRTVSFDEEADVYVINTCSVTAKADAESRRLIRSARKRNPLAKVVVTGCYASCARDEVLGVAENLIVVSNAEKANLAGLIRSMDSCTGLGNETCTSGALPVLQRGSFLTDRSRAYVKIQDGCNGRCSYCIVPKARGSSRSIAVEKVVDEALAAGQAGFAELVLTGIHIGHYGRDLSDNVTLEDLIHKLLNNCTNMSFRLSSIEVNEIHEGLLELVAWHPRVCRHLHIPLQSGSDSVLRSMNRRYRSRDYRRVVDRIRNLNPEICVGADVILGFPGESEHDFQETVSFLSGRSIDYVHAFTFSGRAGTPAADMPEQVPAGTRQLRTRKIRGISRQLQERFASFLVGRTARAVVQAEIRPGIWRVLTDNFQSVEATARNIQPRDAIEIVFAGDGRAEIAGK